MTIVHAGESIVDNSTRDGSIGGESIGSEIIGENSIGGERIGDNSAGYIFDGGRQQQQAL